MDILAVKEMSTWRKFMLTLNYTWLQLVLSMIVVFSSPESNIKAANSDSLHRILEQDGVGLLLLLGVVLGPFYEELLFRLGLYNAVRLPIVYIGKAIGVSSSTCLAASVVPAILVSALTFAWAHGETSVTTFTAHAIFGVAAGHLYFKTGTIAAPIIMHMLNNAVPFSIMVLAAAATVA